MGASDSHYVHGTEPWEQDRLSTLNTLLNATSLDAIALSGGESILDVGSGLGQFSRLLAGRAAPGGTVVGVERNSEQLAEARRKAAADGESDRVDFRQGDAARLPLEEDEWGSFDVVHTRFVLEHVDEPLEVVRGMVRAARPGGRIVLEDDDHEILRLWPDPPGVMELWRAYYTTYDKRGKNSRVGRHLVSLLHEAGAQPRANRCLNFGSCAGDPNFDAMVDNFAGVMIGARAEIVELALSTDERIDAALHALEQWRKDPAAAIWYTTCWAEGRRGDTPTATR
jgi:ubiquinone/menaquinone biosynthesis C-methylase UbiE